MSDHRNPPDDPPSPKFPNTKGAEHRPTFARPRVVSPRLTPMATPYRSMDGREDPPEPFAAPEPLRLALPTNQDEEASLILAAGAPEDFNDEEDWEDDWLEDDEESGEGIQLDLAADQDDLDDLRNLEERRSFSEPIWNSRARGAGFDQDISLFDESEEEDEDILESPAARAARLARESIFAAHDDVEMGTFSSGESSASMSPPSVAAVRLGANKDGPLFRTALTEQDDAIAGWEDEVTDGDVAVDNESHPEADPLRGFSFMDSGAVDNGFDESLFFEDSPSKVERTEVAERDRVSALLWQIVITLLLVMVGWLGFELVEELTQPTVTQPIPELLMSPEQIQLPASTPTPTPEPPLAPEPTPIPEPTPPVPQSVSDESVEQADAPPVGLPAMDEASVAARLDPTLGELRIESDRPARVYLDGQNIGTTPLSPRTLPVGEYDLRLVDVRSGKAQQLRARVDAGKVSRVVLSFE